MKHVGKIIEPPIGNIRDHERRTAKAIAQAGYVVEFTPTSELHTRKSPDVVIDGIHWEMKSPTSSNMGQIERNIKRASKQSRYIIIDSQRIKNLPDKKIEDYLRKCVRNRKLVKKLWFINQNREIIDVKT